LHPELLGNKWDWVQVDETNEKKSRYRIILPVIIVVLIITAYMITQFLFVPRTFFSNTVKIIRVKKEIRFTWVWADVWIEGELQEVHYYSFRFYVDIENSKTSDASNLRLVVNLIFNNSTVASVTRIIRTLKAMESKNIVVLVDGVAHVYLYDKSGNSRGMIQVVTLYSGDEVLDQKTVT